MLGHQHIGKTRNDFKETIDVYKFLNALPAEPTDDPGQGLTWQELFVLYKMGGGKTS